MIDFNDIFEYLDGRLMWKKKISKKVVVGSIAGCKRWDGYIIIGLFGANNYAHRIIWEMHYGEIPSCMEIDHINGASDDNRLCNLRLVNGTQNRLNSKKYINNTSGINGVSFIGCRGKWRSTFRDKTIGYFDSVVDAFNARLVEEISSGLCTERHGK